MKRKLSAMLFIALISLLALLLLFVAGIASARIAGYSLSWWTVDNGGGTSNGGKYQLSGTIGQPEAGALSGGDYRLEGGFWGGVSGVAPFQRVYLPLTVK